MDKSILLTIKKLLGIHPDYTEFDVDIIAAINTTFAVLTQMGIGPSNGFSIEDEKTLWSDYIDDKRYEMVKHYIFLRVKMLFDPPQSSMVSEVYKKEIEEYGWRLNFQYEVDESENK